MAVGLTCTEQDDTSIRDAVKREITQGLVEGHGVDKGIAVAGVCEFYEFETCLEIRLCDATVRCMCVVCDACRVSRCALVVDLAPIPPPPPA